MLRAISAALLILFTTSSAYALEEIPGKSEFADLLGEEQVETAGGLMATQIDGAWYMQINPRFDLRLGSIGLGIQAPLNLRVSHWDEPGKEKYGAQVVRTEDWDEIGDYFKILRYVQYGEKRDFIYARLGELNGKIGQGTIVKGYTNTMDINSHRLGLAFDVNTDYGGVETLFSDMISFFGNADGSQLFAGRAYVKPLSFFMPDSALNIFSLGFTVATDLSAPLSVDADQNKEIDVDPETGDIVVAENKAVTVMGIGLDALVFNNDLLVMVPYTDLNFIAGAGTGFHLGVETIFKLPVGIDFQIPTILEYRHFQSDYIPRYFDTFYERQRFSYLEGLPKGGYLTSDYLKDQEALHGIYGELGFNFVGLVTVVGKYEQYGKTEKELEQEKQTGVEIGKGQFSLMLLVPALEVLQFEAYYRRTNITGADDLFKFDDRSVAIAQAKYQLYPFVYLVAQASRKWLFDSASGAYKPSDSYGFGVDFAYQF